jgi:hypothetical protein
LCVPVAFKNGLESLLTNGLIHSNTHFVRCTHQKKTALAFDLPAIFRVCEEHPEVQPRLHQQMITSLVSALNRGSQALIFPNVPVRWSDQTMRRSTVFAAEICNARWNAEFFQGRAPIVKASNPHDSSEDSDEQIEVQQKHQRRRRTASTDEKRSTKQKVGDSAEEAEQSASVKPLAPSSSADEAEQSASVRPLELAPCDDEEEEEV